MSSAASSAAWPSVLRRRRFFRPSLASSVASAAAASLSLRALCLSRCGVSLVCTTVPASFGCSCLLVAARIRSLATLRLAARLRSSLPRASCGVRGGEPLPPTPAPSPSSLCLPTPPRHSSCRASRVTPPFVSVVVWASSELLPDLRATVDSAHAAPVRACVRARSSGTARRHAATTPRAAPPHCLASLAATRSYLADRVLARAHCHRHSRLPAVPPCRAACATSSATTERPVPGSSSPPLMLPRSAARLTLQTCAGLVPPTRYERLCHRDLECALPLPPRARCLRASARGSLARALPLVGRR